MVNNIVQSSKLVLSWTLTLHRFNRIHKYSFCAYQAMSRMWGFKLWVFGRLVRCHWCDPQGVATSQPLKQQLPSADPAVNQWAQVVHNNNKIVNRWDRRVWKNHVKCIKVCLIYSISKEMGWDAVSCFWFWQFALSLTRLCLEWGGGEMEKGVVLRLFSLHLEIGKRLLSECIPSAHFVVTCLCVSYFVSFLKRKLVICGIPKKSAGQCQLGNKDSAWSRIWCCCFWK